MTRAAPTRSRLPLAEQHPPDARLPEIVRRIRETYLPDPPRPRVSAEPLDGLIETILAQQNAGPITRRQFAALKGAFPTWDHALAAGPDAIEDTLRQAGGGLSRLKADYIYGVLHALDEERGALSLKDTRHMTDAEVSRLLEGLPGVGPKSSACVLLFELARPAMPVAPPIERVTRRLELAPARWNAVKLQRWYDEVLPRDFATRYAFHVGTIRHGRAACTSGRPKCESCILQDLCPSAAIVLGERG